MALPRASAPLALALGPALALLAGTGCSMMIDDLGVGFGGSQGIELARELIEAGGVPNAAQFTAEGLFSQHDIPTPSGGEPCAETLCPRASLARVQPVDQPGGTDRMLVQVALASGLEQLERPPLNLAFVVDISGSMEGEKLDATKLALHAAVDQLDEGDRLALVSFSSTARVEAASRVMDADGRATLHAEIDELHVEDATNIEAGLALGLAELEPHRDGLGGVEDRVMLFTDAQPNLGATSSDSFVDQARDAADVGVSLSVFGVGLDLGAELAREVSELRGGNSFYLADADRIATVFDDEFATIVTPLGYGLSFTVRAREGFSLVAAYGTPDADAQGEISISAATAFVSSRRGAMAVVLEGDLGALEAGAPVVGLTLEYETTEGEQRAQTIEAAWFGGDLPIGPASSPTGAADGVGSAKLAVLLDEYLALAAGAEACDGSLSEADALARIEVASERLDAMAETLDDAPLAAEAALMRKLADNLVNGGCGHD